MPQYLAPDPWLRHLLSSRAARDGGVIRRKIRDIERFVGRGAFLEEMRRRGSAVVENSGQFVIFCNRDPLRRIV